MKRTILSTTMGLFCISASYSTFSQESGTDNVERILINSSLVGKGETRANVKIDSEMIAKLPSGIGAAQLLQQISGIQVGSSDALGGGGFDSTINMRGFGKDQIGFSIDGIPNGRTTLGGGAVPNRFLETPNIAGVDVSQSAGVVGSPSRQALVGHVNYITDDPSKQRGFQSDLSIGSQSYSRYFVRFDTGEIAEGLTAYLSLSHNHYDVWIGDGAGAQKRSHVDFKIVKELENGGLIKFRNSYNDRDGVGYNIVSFLPSPCIDEPNRCFYDPYITANPAFTIDPTTDGYTDEWTGDPMIDRLNRRTRGNERKDNLAYFEFDIPLTDNLDMIFKPYVHNQDGIGRFANHKGEGAVPAPIGNDSDPILYFRKNDYKTDRYGAIFELTGFVNESVNWKAGIWYEDYNRTQVRTWHDFVDVSSGPEYLATPYHTSEDKEWDNKVTMFYVSNKSSLLDDQLILEYGFSILDNSVDYKAPIQDTDSELFNISSRFADDSGIAPKISALYKLSENLELFGGYAKNVATITDGIMEDIGDEASSGDSIGIDVDLDEADVFDLGMRYFTKDTEIGIQVFSLQSTEFTPIDLANSLASTTVSQGRKVRGLETTYNAYFGALNVYFSGTIQRHEYDNEAHVPFTQNGQKLVGIPTKNAYLALNYDISEKFSVSLNANYISERAGFYADPLSSTGLAYSDITNAYVFTSAFFISEPNFDHGPTAAQLDSITSSSETIPSYTVFGLDASYDLDLANRFFESIKFNLSVENLTDKVFLSGVAPELLGTDRKWAGRYFLGAPRTATFTVSAKF